jgi:hypothetical protein
MLNGRHQGVRVLVDLRQKSSQQKCLSLIRAGRNKEAFQLVSTKAEVVSCFLPGTPVSVGPVIVLDEV